MRKTKLRKGNQTGLALLTALIFISLSVLVLIALMGRYTQERLIVDRFEDYYLVFEAVEAAIQRCVVEVEHELPGIIGLENWEPEFDEAGGVILPGFDEAGVTPEFLEGMPQIEFIAYTHPWFGDGRDNNGDGIVDSLAEFGMFSVHAAARVRELAAPAPNPMAAFNIFQMSTVYAQGGGQARQLEAVYSSADLNVWNNAIFAGTGLAAGALINGNVSIHGSVHLLGDNLNPEATAVSAIDLSGTSLISNNYAGMPPALRQRIPNPPTRDYNGETVETLNTTVRVRRGRVGISGNAYIGQNQVAGSGYKGPVDGTYINDGFTGNQVTDDGGRGTPNPAQFHSDNGHTERYDLGNRIPMPYLEDDWREPDGTRVMNPDTGTWYTHEDYFTEVLLANPNVKTDGIYNGNITLNAWDKKGGDAIYWNSTTETYLTGEAARAATPNPNDDFFKFDPVTNLLQMNGQIRINGNLEITGKGNQTTVIYSGRAAFLVDGQVTLNTDLITVNNGNAANIANSFPVNNIIGIMATENMYVGTTAQLSLMGAFYSEKAIITEKQTNVLGTFVANYFNMGTNVPRIYQVPTLVHNLPYGMIGNYPIIVLSPESWREVGI